MHLYRQWLHTWLRWTGRRSKMDQPQEDYQKWGHTCKAKFVGPRIIFIGIVLFPGNIRPLQFCCRVRMTIWRRGYCLEYRSIVFHSSTEVSESNLPAYQP